MRWRGSQSSIGSHRERRVDIPSRQHRLTERESSPNRMLPQAAEDMAPTYRDDAATTLPRRTLPPVCFVFPYMERIHWNLEQTPPAPSELTHATCDGPGAWILQTYVYLRRYGYDVRLCKSFQPNTICILHFDNKASWKLPVSSYLVVVRADRPPVFNCDHCIVQSPGHDLDSRTHYIPHWPQAGMRKRLNSRPPRVRTLGYLGRVANLAPVFRTVAFREMLNRIGVEFQLRSDPHQWTNYEDLDAVLAVRPDCSELVPTKPATKLYNCWQAGCPALLGPEPAFESLRRSELDYLQVRDAEDVIAAIKQLNSNPEYFARVVDHGQHRADEFTPDAIAERWIDLLGGPVAAGFTNWTKHARVNRPFRLTRSVYRVVKQRVARERFRWNQRRKTLTHDHREVLR